MTTNPAAGSNRRPMINAFPEPGRLVELAYRELNQAANGTADQRKQLGDPALLPRPWEPGTCRTPELRQQVWLWLDQVVIWLNHEYTWDVASMIPDCWPEHPHLVHEIAVVADQRRSAHLDPTSNTLEEWHRYCLPAFTDRMRSRLKAHCDHDHGRWPGRSRHGEHTSENQTSHRQDVFNADIAGLMGTTAPQREISIAPRLTVVDENTGEICDEPDD